MTRRRIRNWWSFPANAKSIFFAVFLLYGIGIQVQGAELQVWIRAFIPNNHPSNKDYIRPSPGASNQWMIPAPSLGPLDRLAQLVSTIPLDGSTCFLTDNRGFKSDLNASARLTTAFRINVDGKTQPIEPLLAKRINFPGHSKALNCSSGKILLSKPGLMQIDAVGGPHVANGETQVIVQAAASLPFISGSAWIDYSADFVFDKSKNVLSYRVTLDRFPAYEGYARLDNGNIRRLFAVNPEGDDAWSLLDLAIGISPRVLSGEVEF